MNEPQAASSPAPATRTGRVTLVIAVLALLAGGGLWLREASRSALADTQAEELGKAQRRIAILEDRIDRQRADFTRLAEAAGTEGQAADSLTARIARLEDQVGHLSGASERIRFTWLIAQAEYYLRIGSAEETLAADPAGALKALELADEQLRDAADPRLVRVRKLLAEEITALRAIPKVDREGIALKLGTLAGNLASLPRKQSAPAHFDADKPTDVSSLTGWDRFWAALRNALLQVVSVRRSDVPVTPIMSEEGVAILLRSLELELQMARLAVLRGEADTFRSSVTSVAASIQKYFDTTVPQGAAALATLHELAASPMPGSLPDVSASLTELLKVRERETKP